VIPEVFVQLLESRQCLLFFQPCRFKQSCGNFCNQYCENSVVNPVRISVVNPVRISVVKPVGIAVVNPVLNPGSKKSSCNFDTFWCPSAAGSIEITGAFF
jgi:hypothetical protein